MDLFSPARIAAIRSARASLDSAGARTWAASADLRRSLRSAWLRLLVSQENLTVSQRINAMRKRGAELVALRYESGRESRGNMMRAKAQSLQADADLAQSGRELRVAGRTLLRQTGVDDYKAVTATGTLSAAEPPPLPEDPEALLARRTDLALSEASLKSARASVSSAQSQLWPRVSGSYSRSLSGPTEFPNERHGWSAGLSLSLPLFGGGPTGAWHDVAAARRRLEGSRQDLRAARLDALLDIESTWADYARAADLARVQEALLLAARQRNEEADVRYASGLLSYDNWEIIVSDRVGQERSALQARLNAALAEASWERALGRRLGE
jgi:outer membrane protein TolC